MTFVIPGGNDNYHLATALGQPDVETNFAEALPQYGLVLLMQETSEAELNDLSSDLPTDTHLVTYKSPEGATGADAVRAHKKSDIFDCYTDACLRIIDIQSGFGAVKPKLWSGNAKTTSTKKGS